MNAYFELLDICAVDFLPAGEDPEGKIFLIPTPVHQSQAEMYEEVMLGIDQIDYEGSISDDEYTLMKNAATEWFVNNKIVEFSIGEEGEETDVMFWFRINIEQGEENADS